MRKVGAFFVYLFAFAVIIAMAAFFVGVSLTSGEGNARFVYVDGVNVSRLTRDETEQLLISNGIGDKAASPLIVTTFRGERFEVDPVRSGVFIPVEKLVEDAYAVAHDSDIVTNLIHAVDVYLHPVDITWNQHANIDYAYIDALVNGCVERVQSNMGSAEYVVDAQGGALKMIKGWNALNIDKADFRDAIIGALQAGQTDLFYNRLSSEITPPNFDAIHDTLWREPSDAYFLDDGNYTVVDEVVGCQFDVQQARAIWDAAQPGEEVRIPLEIIWPSVTGEQLRGLLFHDLLGACLTKFPNSGENRRSNLALCASKIDGYIVNPGEIFSYNEVVGERTEAAGFKPAPAYVDGAEKDEIGGGACQVSSTLYAATAFAFLETVERSNHMFKVSYMQRGTDATVTIPAEGKVIDFKFRNNKNFPIKIRAEFNNEESTINVEIWGTLEEDDYMPVEFDNTYGWEHDYDRVIEPADPNRPGYKIKFDVETWGFEDDFSTGYRTLTHRLVIDENGNTVDDQVLNAQLPTGGPALDTYYQHP